jgi:CheY-like chemotaxis protein
MPGRFPPLILLAEDHQETAEMLLRLLDNYDLRMAQTKAEAIRLAREGSIDLYLIDYWLPDGDGASLIQVIRHFDPHTPIIFYSGEVGACAREAARAAGATTVLEKPVDFERLEETIRQLLGAPGPTPRSGPRSN